MERNHLVKGHHRTSPVPDFPGSKGHSPFKIEVHSLTLPPRRELEVHALSRPPHFWGIETVSSLAHLSVTVGLGTITPCFLQKYLQVRVAMVLINKAFWVLGNSRKK